MLHPDFKILRPKHNLLALLVIVMGACAFAEPGQRDEARAPGFVNQTPNELTDVGITEHLGTKLNLDLSFKDEQNKSVTLGSFFADKKPVILSLVYFACPNLCNYHLNGLNDALRQIRGTAGKDFHLVAISIDPKETPEVASGKKASYLKAYGRVGADKGWHFLTGEQTQIDQIAKTVGFAFHWDSEQKQWAHASSAYVITPSGEISRYLRGIYFQPDTVRLALAEADRGRITNVIDSLVLYCFHFDPKANKYTLYAANLMRAVAALVVMVLGYFEMSQKVSPATGFPSGSVIRPEMVPGFWVAI